MRPDSRPRPPSAVSGGVGVAGLAGLALWIMIARRYGMDGPNAGLAAVAACGLPMLAWSILVDRVHRRAGTGIDWTMRRPWAESLPISLVKLVGLWATWGAIAVCYRLGGWYAEGPYPAVMALLAWWAPWLAALSVPYMLWIDRRLTEPRDGAWALGRWLLGGPGAAAPSATADHARAWGVKGFFLAFMLAIVPGNFAEMIHWRAEDIGSGPVALTGFLIATMFLVDVAFATAGYIATMRPLDAHIRSANPRLDAWVAALVCYPPFVLMSPGGPLHYQTDTRDWAYWLAGHDALLWLWGAALVALTGLYAWATVAFGLRFSNLTHRGILTHGPYRLTRHPAYVAKNAFWWLSSLPFLTTTHDGASGLRNAVILGLVSAVYAWRAWTEERHLSADPVYHAYVEWSDAHAPLTRAFGALVGRPAAGGKTVRMHPLPD